MTPPPPPPPPPSQTTPAPANRLADSNSPYLLQHAHNPVDWFPWGEEAFAEARRRDVPIFVSVGYSTCYWCHVMERESFEDEATAAVMNERFVCVKVDREERPDVDELTMSATVIFTGRGGWPTSVFLEPESLRPFFAGTYFPNEPRHGMPSFTHVLESLSNAWTGQRAEVIAQAEAISAAVREQVAASHEPVPVGQADIERAVATLLQMFDRANGGFGGAPKFPQPSFIEFLLDARATADDATSAAIDTAIRTTLDAMMIGGIHDHLAGGFHRYAVDEYWTVPHFEKMLYDNAQLASLYARAASVYDDDEYARTAKATADFVLEVMSPNPGSGKSGFFSAKDAEVDHREGLDYLWTAEEFAEVLGDDDAALASRLFGLDQGPNFQDPHHPEEPRRSVLRLETRRDQLAGSLGKDPDQLQADLTRITAQLLANRDTRKQSAIDDKVIAGWNGLMIAGLARTAAVSGQDAQRYLDAGFDAARFVLGSMRGADSGLLRASRNGSAAIDAPLEDHAFMIQGLLTLAEASPATAQELIESATRLTEHALAEFADESGRFYDTRADRPDLFARTRSTHDGATPSAIGVMLQNFIVLHRLTGDDKWLGHAGRVLESISHAIHENPVSCVNSTRQLLAMLRLGDAAAAHYAFASPSERTPAAQPQTRQPVRVMANADQLVVAPDTPAVFSIALEMDPGWHIVAAQPVAEGEPVVPVTPLRVGLTSGMGVAVYAEYPDGTSFGVPGIGDILVHEDRVEFRVMLEHKPGVGASPGTPVLGVSFQACNDRECAPPRTVELEIAVEIKSE